MAEIADTIIKLLPLALFAVGVFVLGKVTIGDNNGR